MTRPVTRRAAACLAAVVATVLATTLLTGLGAGLGSGRADAAGSPRTAAPADDAPLGVSLDTLFPSVIPPRGEITLTGVVTNRSDDTWTDLQVYVFHSAAPITTRTDLVDAAASDPATEIGQRIAADGRFDELGDLAPGETAQYAVSVSRADLAITGDPGVYWLGTHVLGAVDGIRDLVADGRARSFMPLMERSAPTTRLALVVPLRERVRRRTDGTMLGIGRWQRSLASDGRLGRLASFAATGPGELSWMVDPAVLDAVGSVAADNPPFATGDDGTGPDDEGGDEPSASPSPSGEADPDDPDAEDEPSPEAQSAQDWLQLFRTQAGQRSVWALPYGDIDVSAVSGNRLRGVVSKSTRLSEDTMAGLEVDADPLVAPPRGYLTGRALAAVDDDVPVLMSDGAFPSAEGAVVGRPDGTRVVLADSAVAGGGPGPNRRTSALAMRQRILSDAALNALSPERDQPLVVTLPTRFDPGPDWQSADFFGGLDVPWLRQVDLDTVLDEGPAWTTLRLPFYPARQRAAHIPLANQLATQEVGDLGGVYADLLTRNDSVGDEIAKSGMLASSYFARARADAALTRARGTALRVRRNMQRVVIDGPPFVMMSSETGPIAVTIENQLDETVTVQIEAETRTPDLEISTPDPLTLDPGQRAPVRMRADSSSIGVHSVSLVATTIDGAPLGSRATFNVRTSNVGFVIWLIIGAAGALLGLAIVVRLVRRVRAARATTEDTGEPEPTATATKEPA